MDEQEREKRAADLFKFVYELAQSSYESELRRQSQIVDQSRTVQTVFSIILVAIVTIIPWLKDVLAGRQELIILVTVFYFILFAFLVSSLILACLAQHRHILQCLPDVDVLEKTMNDNFQQFLKDDTKEKFKIDELAIIQKDITKDNDYKIKLVNVANIILIVSISLILVFAFITAFLIIFS